LSVPVLSLSNTKAVH